MITPVMCLALNIYFEAAGESVEGKWAVAQVVVNRVYDSHWPNTICEVVKQKKQFTWYWDGKSDVPDKKSRAWRVSYGIAMAVIAIEGSSMYDFSGGANHYFNPNLADPDWQHCGVVTTTIGNHVFMRLRYAC